MDTITIHSKHLTKEELVCFFENQKRDFVSFNDSTFIEEYAQKLSNNASFVVCCSISNEVVGVIAAYMNRPPICYISHVCVTDKYKRLGLYTKMIRKLEADALERECSKIRLEVRNDNMRAMNAYMKTGFNVSGTAREGCVYMEKNI